MYYEERQTKTFTLIQRKPQYNHTLKVTLKRFEVPKAVLRIRISKDRQENGLRIKDTQWPAKHYTAN